MTNEPQAIEVPGFLWGALELARGTLDLLTDPNPERGILTALHERGVSDTYDAVVGVRNVLHETIEGATGDRPWDSEAAAVMVEFMEASIAVWREIDRLDSRTEGYVPTDMDVELRKRERAAWERYKPFLNR
jgi:hypothetical protein